MLTKIDLDLGFDFLTAGLNVLSFDRFFAFLSVTKSYRSTKVAVISVLFYGHK